MNMNSNKIIEHAENRLLSLGYFPKHIYEDQLDCIINGIAFAIYGNNDGETFGFGCIFEPAADKYAESFLEELKARFGDKYAPFQNLLMCEDGFLHLEKGQAISCLPILILVKQGLHRVSNLIRL